MLEWNHQVNARRESNLRTGELRTAGVANAFEDTNISAAPSKKRQAATEGIVIRFAIPSCPSAEDLRPSRTP